MYLQLVLIPQSSWKWNAFLTMMHALFGFPQTLFCWTTLMTQPLLVVSSHPCPFVDHCPTWPSLLSLLSLLSQIIHHLDSHPFIAFVSNHLTNQKAFYFIFSFLLEGPLRGLPSLLCPSSPLHPHLLSLSIDIGTTYQIWLSVSGSNLLLVGQIIYIRTIQKKKKKT